jgi:tetraprenyl-beta-curcumene synthase
MHEAANQRLIARAAAALALMSARYWTTVVPGARRQMHRWHARAQAIPDPALRELALSKLAEERFNAQTAPTFATLAPRDQRPGTVEAIIALQIIYDYLDGLTEQPVSEPLRNGHELFRALTDAVSPLHPPHQNYYRYSPHCEDGGYLSGLVGAVRGALLKLPAGASVSQVARAAAVRCGEAQARVHAVPSEGTAVLEGWASGQAAQEGISWPQFVASAASAVISIHALIAAAADPHTTPAQAARIEVFHRSTCALATTLDGLADLAQDERSGESELGYLRYFPDRDALATELVDIARRAVGEAERVPHGGHHLMTLAGVVAYYASALSASESSSKAVVAPVQRELQPLIAPPLAFMHAWRLAKRLREQTPNQHGCASIPQADTSPTRERLTL